MRQKHSYSSTSLCLLSFLLPFASLGSEFDQDNPLCELGNRSFRRSRVSQENIDKFEALFKVPEPEGTDSVTDVPERAAEVLPNVVNLKTGPVRDIQRVAVAPAGDMVLTGSKSGDVYLLQRRKPAMKLRGEDPKGFSAVQWLPELGGMVSIGKSGGLSIEVFGSDTAATNRFNKTLPRADGDWAAHITGDGKVVIAKPEGKWSGKIPVIMMQTKLGNAKERATTTFQQIEIDPAMFFKAKKNEPVEVFDVAVSPTGDHSLAVFGSWNGELLILNMGNLREAPKIILDTKGKPVREIEFSKDGKTLFAGLQDGRVLSWAVQGSGPEAKVVEPPITSMSKMKKYIDYLSPSPSGDFVMVGSGYANPAELVDRQGKSLGMFEKKNRAGNHELFHKAIFSADENTVVFVGDKKLFVFDRNTRKFLKEHPFGNGIQASDSNSETNTLTLSTKSGQVFQLNIDALR